MGKAKNESDDDHQMDIEEVRQQAPPKKKKLIVKKNRPESSTKSTTTTSKSLDSSKNVVREIAKQVNLKQKHRSLQQKQNIFSRVVKALHDKTEISKKDKKKTRLLMKKELRKHLEQDRIHERKRSAELEANRLDAPVQVRNPEKFKKPEINERKQAAEFKSLMGAGLANIRNMVAQNTIANPNINRQANPNGNKNKNSKKDRR